MRKICILTFLLLLSAIFSNTVKAQTPIVVFSDNFNRASFLTGNAYGTPATTYKFTLGGAFTLNTALVSGSNYQCNMTSPAGAQKALYYAPLAPYSAPFSRELSLNPGLVTWTFNMRTNTAVTATSLTAGAVSGGMDLCGTGAGNIFNGAPTGYGVVFNSSATGGVDLVRFSGGLASSTVLIAETTTMPKTDFYSVRVTYDPTTNHWSLFVRDDGALAFADPSSGVTTQQGATITDATYANVVMVNFGAIYSTSAGAGKTMSVDNYQVSVTLPPCGTPGAASALSYSNTATSSTVSFTPPGTAPTGYILVKSSGALSGLPTAGQATTPGTAVGSNGTIVGVGATSPVSTSVALTANTTYTMTLFPYNNSGCTGGPVFNTSVASNTITTCPNAPTLTTAGTPTSNIIPGVNFDPPAAGGGVYSTYTYLLNVYTDAGLSVPAPGYPSGGTVVTSPFDITGLTSGVTYWYTVSAVDGACTSVQSASANATTSVVPCTGFPTAGSTSSTSTQITGSTAFTLGLIGTSGETGISFQWQSSACGATWVNTGGVQAIPAYSTTEGAGTFYQCVVTCANSGLSSTSNPIYVSRVNAPYCFPTSTNGCSAGDGVNAFTLSGECGTSINDAGPMICTAINTDHTSSAPVKLYAGTSYAASVNSNFDGDDVYVWIDFNNSGTFESSEMVYSTNTALVPSLPFFYSFSIPIPAVAAGAVPGLHRMRVVVNQAQTLSTGCDALAFGTSVDYLVQILPNLALNYNSPVCLPGGLTLTATPSLACGSVYTWSGPSGYSNVTLNSNSVTPPAVAGVYSVAVTVNGISSCPTPATTNVSIFTAPTITGVSGMCIGSTATLTGAPSGGSWLSSNASIASIVAATGLATGISLGVATMSYTLPTGCRSTSPMAVTITPSLFTVTGGGNYCAGGAGLHVGLSGSNAGVSYQLYNAGVPAGSPVTGTGAILDFGLITSPGTYTVIGNPGTSCATTMTGAVVIATIALPTAFSITGGGNFCPGTTGVEVGLGNSQSGFSYQLYVNGTATGAPVTGGGSSLDFGLHTIPGTYNIIATNTATGCTNVMAGTATVALLPLPSLYAVSGGGVYCSAGTGVHIGLSNSDGGVSYQLYSGGLPFGTSVAGTGSVIDFGTVSTAGTYRVLGTSAAGCSDSMIGNATVSINPAPAPANVTGGGAYCAGTGGLHIGLNGSVTGTSYNLFNGAALVSSASGTGAPLDFGLETAAGSYTVTATLSSTGCTGNMTGSATITINTLPNPFNVTGGGSYCSGTVAPHVFLSGSVVGATYQLLNGGSPVGVAVAGSGSSLDFGAQAAAGNYSVLATAGTGCINNMSGSAVIATVPLPAGYLITGGGSYCAGGTGVHIGLNSSDIGNTYQLINGVLNVGLPLAGTGSALDFGLQTGSGAYSVVASNNTTLCTANMPGTAVITVTTLPNAYAMTGGGNYCVGGAGQHIGLSNSDAGIDYQLYNGVAAVGPAIGGSGTAIDFGLQTVAGSYDVVATDPSAGCAATMPGSEIIGISALPTAYTLTGGGNICPSGPGVHIGLSGSTIGVNYQLYNGVTAVGLAVAGTGAALDLGAQTATGIYSVIAANPATTCSNNMTGTETINFYPVPAAHTVTGGGSFYCVGGTGVHIGLDGSDAGNTYQLSNGGTLSGSPVAGTGAAIDFGLQTLAGSYTVTATSSVTGCTSSMAGTATVIVDGQPTIHILTGGGNYCAGTGGVHIGVDGSEAGIVYQLYNGITTSGSPMGGTGSPLDFGLEITPGTYSILATNLSTGCSVNMAGMTSVGLSSLPVVYNVSGGGSYCAGGPGEHVLLSGSNVGVNYLVYAGGVPTATTLPGNGSPLDFGLMTAGNYTIKATSSTTTCSNNMTGSALITANPLPDTFVLMGGGSYCAGGAGMPVSLGGSETGVTYQLYANGVPTASLVNGTGSVINFGLQTTGGSYSVTATETGTGCINNMTGGVTVTTTPLPSGYSIGGGGNYCASGTGLPITLSGSTSGINYQLYNGTTADGVPLFGTGSPLSYGMETAGSYSIIATDITTGCVKTMIGTATIGTLSLPVAYNVTGGGTYCAGGAGVHINLSGSATGVSYQLYNSSIATGTPVSGTGAALDFGLQASTGAYTVIATNSASGCVNNMTGSVTVASGALPAAFTVTGSSSTGYCSGGAGVTIYLGNSEAGVSYQLYRGATAVGAPVAGTSGVLSFGPQTLVGVYTVTGQNIITGCSSNMAGSVVVSVNSLPLAYNVTGGGGFCAGGAGAHIGLTGSNTGITYQLYHAGLSIGLSASGTGSGLDLGAQSVPGSYTVIATNTGTGCTSSMTGSATVFIDPAPVAYTVTGGGTFCSGGSGVHVHLTGSATGVSYQLYDGPAVSGAPVSGTGASLDFGLQTISGTYTVLATNGSTGCQGSMAGTAAVTALASPAPYPVSGGGSYCAGGTGVYIGVSGSGTGILYKLYHGSTLIGTAVAGTGLPVNFGLQTLGGTYTVIGMDATTSCISNMPGSAVVTINSTPDVFPVTGGGNYCAGGTGEPVGLAGSSAGISYSVYYGSTLEGTVTGTGTAIGFGMQTGAGSYTVQANNSATGCTAFMAGSATIGVDAVVTPTVMIGTGSGDTLCSGTATTFTAISTNAGTAPTWQWSVNGVMTSTAMSYNYIPANGDVVGLTFTSNAVCAVPATITGSAAITVWEKELPGVTISANPGIEICQGSSVDFTATPSFGGTAPSYVWMLGTAVVSAGPVYSYIPAAGDVITCKMTSNYLCRLANSVTSAPADMVIDTAGVPAVTIAAYPGLNISEGETVTLEASVTHGGPAPTYKWLVNGVEVVGAVSPEFVSDNFKNGDIVACNVLSSGACTGTTGGASVTMIVSNVSVRPVTGNVDNISILPNPNNGSFQVKGSIGNGDNEVSMELTNMLGQIVFANKVATIGGQLNEKVQLGNQVANGMYILSLRSGTETKIFHVVVGQ